MFNFNFTSTMKKYLFALLAVAALFTGCEKLSVIIQLIIL